MLAFKKQCGVASVRDHRIVGAQAGLCRNQCIHGVSAAGDRAERVLVGKVKQHKLSSLCLRDSDFALAADLERIASAKTLAIDCETTPDQV